MSIKITPISPHRLVEYSIAVTDDFFVNPPDRLVEILTGSLRMYVDTFLSMHPGLRLCDYGCGTMEIGHRSKTYDGKSAQLYIRFFVRKWEEK